MKKTPQLIISLFLVTTLVACNNQKEENSYVAEVDGAYITKELYNSELDFYTKYYKKNKGDKYLDKKIDGDTTRYQKLKDDLLSSLVYDQVMANDLQKAEKKDDEVNSEESSRDDEGDKSYSENLLAMGVKAKDVEKIVHQDSIRKDHYKYFVKNNEIKDKDILKEFKRNRYYQKQYKYSALVFDKEKEAESFKEKLKSPADFKEALKKDVKNYQVLNSDFVYEDDKLLKKAGFKEKDKISPVFEDGGKYYILMINSYNENENDLLVKAKDVITRKSYEDYLNSLVKKANIKLFI